MRRIVYRAGRIIAAMRRLTLCATALGAWACGACTPALDWREVRPEGSGVTALFPCHPKSQTRSAALAGAATPMTLLSCGANGQTFALSHAELGDPARVAPALRELAQALAANLGAVEAAPAAPFAPAGATPNPHALRLRLAGRMPDGAPAQEQATLFVRGTRVYQAVVLGERLDEAAAAMFFDSLRLVAP